MLKICHAAYAVLIVVGTAAMSPAIAQQEGGQGPLEKITAAATENRLRLDYDGETFSGPAWDALVDEAASAQFFLIGEEHGISENPLLAAQLFTRLADDGYEHLVIETSPAMASILDEALREDGLDGLRALYAQRGGEPAFFGMEEEAELLAAARATSNAKSPVLLGVDYEVASDPVLLRRLQEKRKPKAASAAMDALVAASDAAWAQYFKTSGPQYIFSFSGDPELVRAVEAAWPNRDEEAAWILDTIEETLEINRRWVSGEGWQSNARRAALLRSNFLRHWRDHASRRGDGPKMMLKLGASHLVRGRNMVETFDLGALLPEIAAMADKRTVSLFVVPGPGSMTAVLNPTNWTYVEAPGKDSYAKDLGAVMDAAFDDGFTLIDLRALRPHMRPQLADAHVDLARIIHGFDYMLVLTGGTASGELDHFAPPRSVE